MKPAEIKAFGQAIRDENKKQAVKRFGLAVLIVVVSFFAFKYFKGDYKFLFKETSFTTANIIDTKTYNEGRFYVQDVLYRYQVAGETYSFITTLIWKNQKTGEQFPVQYAIENPKIHEVIW